MIMNIESALEVLNKDSRMQMLIERYGHPTFEKKNDYFQSLVRSIVFQQLSGKVADIIYQRLVILVPKNRINPKSILMVSDNDMRGVGLSLRKVSYIKNLAVYFDTNVFSSKEVQKMSNEAISSELIQIKGIGQWTVDMFLMFTLNRPDIMPYSDLGIQKAMRIVFNLNRLPTKSEMESLSARWKPYRTIACWYLWKIVDDGVDW
tara:strand:- start:92 stop:706 length:615 start_codon:yes stop_codon:yes gene_type:complete